MHVQLIGLSVFTLLLLLCLARVAMGRGFPRSQSIFSMMFALLTLPPAVGVVCAFFFVSPPSPDLLPEDVYVLIGLLAPILCGRLLCKECLTFLSKVPATGSTGEPFSPYVTGSTKKTGLPRA